MRDKQQFLLIIALTFCFSAILDNIAITIAMLQIARRFFTGHNLLIAGSAIVIAANAGGAWSPIGDVTTVLLWLADKFSVGEIITVAFLPSLVICGIATAMLYGKLDDTSFTKRESGDAVRLSHGEKAVVGTALASFLLPLMMNFIGLPPYMGLLMGLGFTWGMIEFAKQKGRSKQSTHLTANIEKLLGSIDVASIKYIVGILLSVSALATLGILALASSVLLGDSPGEGRLIGMSMAVGLLSAFVDNTSLVVMALDVFPMSDPSLWALLAVAAGTGGSALIISSAAGVVAMGSLRELSFSKYLKHATIPALVGFAGGMLVWLIEYIVVLRP